LSESAESAEGRGHDVFLRLGSAGVHAISPRARLLSQLGRGGISHGWTLRRPCEGVHAVEYLHVVVISDDAVQTMVGASDVYRSRSALNVAATNPSAASSVSYGTLAHSNAFPPVAVTQVQPQPQPVQHASVPVPAPAPVSAPAPAVPAASPDGLWV
jgi:hypothetical protein